MRRSGALIAALYVTATVMILGSLFAVVLYTFLQFRYRETVREAMVGELTAAQMAELYAREAVSDIASDALFMADMVGIHVESDGQLNLREIRQYFRLFALRRKVYDQIRLIGGTAQEVVRVNYVPGEAWVVPDEELQNKRERYYFQEAEKLGRGEVYISPLDLNMERGELELPFKPMIRVATPTFSPGGHKQGIVVLNYLAGQFLDRLGEIRSGDRLASVSLVNADGYYLRCADDPSLEFLFMFPDREQVKFQDREPRAAKVVFSTAQGQMVLGGSIYTWRTVYPTRAAEGPNADTGGRLWKLVTTLGKKNLRAMRAGLWRTYSRSFIAVGIPYLLISGALGGFLYRIRVYRGRLNHMARFDAITGLPNRAFFEDLVGQAMLLAHRKEFRLALLFLDLDGFKEVNDTLGHRAGDGVLREIAARLKSSIRASDVLCRLGGDEFVILLQDVPDASTASDAAEKVRLEILEPLQIDGNTVSVGCSIGVGLYPDHSRGYPELLRVADQAMYQAKRGGKGRVRVAGEAEDG